MASVEQQEILDAVEDVWNEGDLDLVEEFIAEEFVGHMLGDEDIHGVEGYETWVRATLAAFPDAELTFDTVFEAEAFIAGTWTFTGTHEGQWEDMEPTGASVEFEGVFIDRVEDGMVVESWHLSDGLTLMQQLGVVELPTG
ncbi:ester cyclase [Halobacteriaceae archaeon GCM10025711]